MEEAAQAVTIVLSEFRYAKQPKGAMPKSAAA
jgi:hypothetical protein